MKPYTLVFRVVMGVAALGYWSNSTDQHSHATTTAEADSDDDDVDSDSGQFHGFDCTVDCSGHQAGYDWAERHDITDEDNCGGNSESFIEGCKAYVREQQGIAADDDSADDDSDREDD